AHELRIRAQRLADRAGGRIELRQPQREALRAELRDVAAREAIGSFGRIAAPARDELAQIAVARPAGGKQDELQAVVQPELAADDERQWRILRRHVRAYGSGERVC